MKFIHSYIKYRFNILAIFFFFFIIYFISFILFHVPIVTFIYPSFICLLFGIIFLIRDLYYTYNNYKILNNINNFVDVIASSFPTPRTIMEARYQDIINTIYQEHNIYKNNAKISYDDMVNYYTTWVHQIKTPIAAMSLQLQNEDTNLSRNLSNNLLKIEQYVEMVLTFIRLNGDSSDYVFHQLNINNIMKKVIKKFSPEFIQRKILLDYQVDDQFIISDEKWLTFVLEQVVSNALKYTTQGSITITFNNQKLQIIDTGIGIALNDLPRIFEKGYTGYNGRIDQKASGLGLYLCKEICNKLSHTITATSTIGVGTCITIDMSQHNLEQE